MVFYQFINLSKLLNLWIQINERCPTLIMKAIKGLMRYYIFVEMSAENGSGDVKIASDFLLG
jgi:hypothetical protein